MSMPPYSSACATRMCGPSGLERSTDTARTAPRSASVSSSPATVRAPAITRTPSATSAFVTARPMPLLAPVTNATLSRSLTSTSMLQYLPLSTATAIVLYEPETRTADRAEDFVAFDVCSSVERLACVVDGVAHVGDDGDWRASSSREGEERGS